MAKHRSSLSQGSCSGSGLPLESVWGADTLRTDQGGAVTGDERARTRLHAGPIFRAGLTVVIVLVLLFLVFVLYGLADNRWYKIITIDGGSMAPTIMSGDAIVLVRPPENVEAGMVLTLLVDGHLVTHRVVEVGADGGFVTCGDANEARDDWSGNEVTVVGRFLVRLPALGRLLRFGAVAGRSDTNSAAFFWDRQRASFKLVGGTVPMDATAPEITAFTEPTPTKTGDAEEPSEDEGPEDKGPGEDRSNEVTPGTEPPGESPVVVPPEQSAEPEPGDTTSSSTTTTTTTVSDSTEVPSSPTE